jgi:hypothetical protein
MGNTCITTIVHTILLWKESLNSDGQQNTGVCPRDTMWFKNLFKKNHWYNIGNRTTKFSETRV